MTITYTRIPGYGDDPTTYDVYVDGTYMGNTFCNDDQPTAERWYAAINLPDGGSIHATGRTRDGAVETALAKVNPVNTPVVS